MATTSKEGSGHATCPSEPEKGSGESNTGLLLSCQRNESTFMSLKTDPPEGKSGCQQLWKFHYHSLGGSGSRMLVNKSVQALFLHSGKCPVCHLQIPGDQQEVLTGQFTVPAILCYQGPLLSTLMLTLNKTALVLPAWNILEACGERASKMTRLEVCDLRPFLLAINGACKTRGSTAFLKVGGVYA